MEKHVYNTHRHPGHDSEEENHEEGCNTNTSEPTARNQMRGFELITKVFQQITLFDFLKIQKRMHKKHNYHF